MHCGTDVLSGTFSRVRISLPVLALTFTIGFCTGNTALAASTPSVNPAPPRIPQTGRGTFQGPGQRNARKSSIDSRVTRVGTQLNLNDVQRFDLKRLLEAQQAEANRLWSNQDIDPIERMAKLRALQDVTQKRFNALLTEEQRKKYDQLRQKASQQTTPAANDKNLH
jgi:hypothetical protein